VYWALLPYALVAEALALSFGRNSPFADILLLASIPAVALGVRATRGREGAPRGAAAAVWLVALAATVSVAILDPGPLLDPAVPDWPRWLMSAVAVVVVASFAIDLRREGLRPTVAWLRVPWLRAAVLFALAMGLGVWMLRASPSPAIDVWVVHQQGAEAMMQGRQVYAEGTIHAEDTNTYARTIDTYAYPPLNLILTTAAYAVTGETRWAQLVALGLGGLFLRAVAARAGWRPPIPDLLMVCLLFHPRGLFVLQQSWGEPLALPLLGGFALMAVGGQMRVAAILLGLLCALKQHYLLYLPALALVPGIGLEGLVVAVATAAATYAPFAIAAPRGLWDAVVMHHIRNPFRADSLSLTAILWKRGVVLPPWTGFVGSIASLGVLRGVPRSLGALLLVSSFTFLVFYVLGRQAFCNYYYLLGATWLFAAAALAPPTEARRG
jgi:hypothetical protein